MEGGQGFKEEPQDNYHQEEQDEGGSLKRPADGDYNGNVKRMRESSDVDSNAPTTLRILIQSKDAGGIIGKGGTNIRRLRTEYNAVVNVPDTNSNERVLTITAPRQSALDILAEVVPKIGEVQYGHEIQMLVQRSQVGSIIGRAGYKIKEIREGSGANVKVFADCLPNSTERVVTMSGSAETIVKCVENVLVAIANAPLKGQVILFDPSMQADDFGYDGGFGGPGFGGGPMRGGPMGGRGGPRGRGMQRGRGGPRGGGRGGFGGDFGGDGGRFDASNMGGATGGTGNMFGGVGGTAAGGQTGQDFSQDMSGSGFGDSSFQAGGQMNQWNQGGASSGGNTAGGDQTSTQVTIPKDLAGSIIGKGGERIKMIRNRCNAVIKIDDPLPGSNDRIITITGNQEQINHAQYLLQQSVQQYSGKKF
ncbi:heterogeneous nuclear ribonucleoprotein K isoform X1 [Nematostella vectensis]|uniref:heterogeneous nuclear ribonucleoprotein K isoform X1 n=1 Tax=Nematostella vectensis TaxID=45351 RepID=UPI00138FF6ED|nr:heterogeneous nuclear ribonucleoprotein K isoform X1 [Nematostella vectensis]XP_032233403.1 heterogeneous nuclear ribonucleoprotein K isoform X1 [Nematostella vectensis]